MRAGVFLDTSAWFASISKREHHHASEHQAYLTLLEGARRLVTSQLVVAEMHALLVRRLGRQAGLNFLDRVYGDATHDVRVLDRDVEAAAIERWLRPLRDHGISLCDAVSFELMRREGLQRAFALEEHPINLLRDRQVDVLFPGKLMHGAGGPNAFGHGLHPSEDFAERLAAA